MLLVVAWFLCAEKLRSITICSSHKEKKFPTVSKRTFRFCRSLVRRNGDPREKLYRNRLLVGLVSRTDHVPVVPLTFRPCNDSKKVRISRVFVRCIRCTRDRYSSQGIAPDIATRLLVSNASVPYSFQSLEHDAYNGINRVLFPVSLCPLHGRLHAFDHSPRTTPSYSHLRWFI